MKKYFITFILLTYTLYASGQNCIIGTHNLCTDFYRYLSDSVYEHGYMIFCVDGHENIADSVFALEFSKAEHYDSTGNYSIDNCVPYISKNIVLYKNLYYINPNSSINSWTQN